MSTTDEIRDLYAFNRWANGRILDVAAALDDDALARDLGSSFPSVLATFAHMMAADWIWLRRWAGESPSAMPAEWDLGSLAAVRAIWDDIEADRATLIARLDDQALGRAVDYRDMAGRPWTSRMDDMLRHVVNHSTYHRGQLVTMIRQLGAKPPVTDLIAYYRERDAAS